MSQLEAQAGSGCMVEVLVALRNRDRDRVSSFILNLGF